MELIADLHTHTVACSHAFSTIEEMAQEAVRIGLKALAITEHARPGVGDAPHEFYFKNIVRLPAILPSGLLLLKGAELNVMGPDGDLAFPQRTMQMLDWVIASMHRSCLRELDYDETTNAWLRVAETPHVDMIGHPEQEVFLFDYDRVTKALAAHNKVVEMNAHSQVVRPGNEENMRRLALSCKANGTKIAVNSDAHSLYDLGNTADVLRMLEEIDFPEENVINSSMPRLLAELERHGRPVAGRVCSCFA